MRAQRHEEQVMWCADPGGAAAGGGGPGAVRLAGQLLPEHVPRRQPRASSRTTTTRIASRGPSTRCACSPTRACPSARSCTGAAACMRILACLPIPRTVKLMYQDSPAILWHAAVLVRLHARTANSLCRFCIETAHLSNGSSAKAKGMLIATFAGSQTAPSRWTCRGAASPCWRPTATPWRA